MLRDKFTQSIKNLLESSSDTHHDLTHLKSEGEVYDETQTNESIKDGHTFSYIDHTGKKSVGILNKAWPVSINGAKGGDLHHLKDGASWESTQNGKYADAVKAALSCCDDSPKPASNDNLKESYSLNGIPKWAGETINEFAPLVGMAVRGIASGLTSSALSGGEKEEQPEEAEDEEHLQEMAMDTITHPTHGKLTWENNKGVHQIKSSHATLFSGTHQEAASKWKALKNHVANLKEEKTSDTLTEISSDLRQAYIKKAMSRVRSKIADGDKEGATRTAKFAQKALSKETEDIKEAADTHSVDYDIPTEHRGNNDVKKAAIRARAISDKEGCVQHVNINKLGHVHVSDWHAGSDFDSDMSPDNDHRNEKTIISYNRGRAL